MSGEGRAAHMRGPARRSDILTDGLQRRRGSGATVSVAVGCAAGCASVLLAFLALAVRSC